MPLEKETLESTYQELVSFYGLAEELIDGLDHQREEQIDMVEPLVERVETATDILVEEYRYFANGRELNDASKKRVEMALKDINQVLNNVEGKNGRHEDTPIGAGC